MSELVTRCPCCQATFRATQEQLEAATGRVRCGACLVVFDAHEHQLLATSPLTTTALPPEPARMSPGADSAPSQRIAAPPSALAAGAPGLRRARSRLHDVLNAPAATPAPRGGLARAAAVVTATVLGIVIQYIYFHVDLLARQFAYRPALEQFCALLPCTVPPLRDLSRIRAQNLLVRTHPTVANALQLDALLVNEAPFAQPFPRLLLMFQDLQGAVVARRHYTPAEYQGGELAGATTMPAQRSVRLRLEFLDPGESAVSYSLDPLD